MQGRDTVKKDNTQAIAIGIGTAIFIFLIGFVAMWIFWQYEKTGYLLNKGFWYWKAATWGDGLCLSVLVGALVAYKRLLEKIQDEIQTPKETVNRQKAISYIFGSTFGMAAVVIQASWLISNDTKPNWTIPDTHHFMPSGWYHAGYFVFMFFLVAMLMCQVFFLRKNITANYAILHNNPIHKTLLSLVWFSGLSYLFMHNIDDYYTSENYLFVTITTLGVFVCIGTTYCILSNNAQPRKNKIFYDLQNVLAGSFCALGFDLMVYRGVEDYYTPLVCALLSITLIFPFYKHMGNTIFYILFISIPTFWVATTISNEYGNYIFVFAFFTMILPAILSRGQGERVNSTSDKSPSFWVPLIAIFSILLCKVLDELSYFNNQLWLSYLQGIFVAVVSILVSTNIKVTFTQILTTEKQKEKNPTEENCRNLEKATLVTYIIIGLVALGTVLCIVKYLMDSIGRLDVSDYPIASNLLLGENIHIFVLTVSSALLLWLGGQQFRSRWGQGLPYKLTTIFLLILVYYSLFKVTIISGLEYLANIWSLWNIVEFVLIILISTFVSTGLYANLINIRAVNIKDEVFSSFGKVLSSVVFAGTFLCLVVVFCYPNNYGNVSPSWEQLIMSLLILFFCLLVLPLFVGRTLLRSFEEGNQAGVSTPLSGVGHDGFLIMFVAIVSVLIPIFVISTAPKDKCIPWLINSLIIVGGLYFPLTFSFENNVNMMNQLIEKYHTIPQKQESLHSISIHVRRQNILVFLILLPWSIIPFAIEFLLLAISKTTWRDQSILINQDNPNNMLKNQSLGRLFLDKFLPKKYIIENTNVK